MKITPEMIEAGADVIFADLGMISVWGSEGPSILAEKVWLAMSAVAKHTFEVDEGPDKLMLHYRPESILGLAKTIEAAKSMGVADPLPEMLQTELYGSFK